MPKQCNLKKIIHVINSKNTVYIIHVKNRLGYSIERGTDVLKNKKYIYIDKLI